MYKKIQDREDSFTKLPLGIPLKIWVSSVTLISWIAFGTFVFHRLESWSRIESFYFAVVTITTVGYGDLTPSTELSKLFTSIYILVGVSIGLVTLSIIGSSLLDDRERAYIKKHSKKNN